MSRCQPVGLTHALIAVIMLLLGTSTALGQWSIETVDSPRAIYASSSLELDALGYPIIAYAGETLHLVRQNHALQLRTRR